jgi:hypothetical protein
MSNAPLPNTARIGGMDKQALMQSLQAHNIQLNQAATTLFQDPRFTITTQRKDIEIAILSVGELGLQGATYQQLLTRASERGLVECPLELGAHLRLQLVEQPEGSIGFTSTQHRAPPGAITVASAPLDDSDETPKGFYLRRIEGALWLRGYCSWPGHLWSPEDVFVFARGSL